MRWARNIAGLIAALATCIWIDNALFHGIQMSQGRLTAGGCRGYIFITWINDPSRIGRSNIDIVPTAVWRTDRWIVPRFISNDGTELNGKTFSWRSPSVIESYSLHLPHWLTNLVAWSLFIMLWRRTRKHPEGCCQKCGYSLKRNESEICPECGEAVGVEA